MKHKETVAPEQLELDGMPLPDFDRMGYSDTQLAKAEHNIDLFNALKAHHPDLMPKAYLTVVRIIADQESCGIRLLGELLRVWLAKMYGTRVNNGVFAVMVRELRNDHPWLKSYLHIRPCALDVLMGCDVA